MTDSRLDDSRLRRLLDVARALAAELDLDSILRRVLEAASDLTEAQYAAVGVLAADRTSFARFETLGMDAETVREIGDPPSGQGVLGVLIREQRPLRISDIGAHPRSYGFPLGHPPMRSFLGVPLAVSGEAWGNIYLTETAHGEFDEADEEAIVALAELASAAIETALAYATAHAHSADLERSVSGLAATTAIARAIGGETRLDRVLELIVKRGRALVEARTMLIVLIDGDELVVRATAGDAPQGLLGARFAVADSAMSALLATGRSERIDDAPARLRLAVAEALRPQTALIVPLSFHGHSVGALEAFDKANGADPFTEDDERLLEAFAASAAMALGSAQEVAAETLRRSIDASERERARWARELHDETLQELGAISITLASASGSDEPETLKEAVRLALGYGEYAMVGLREIITDLRPAALDALGTQAALESLAVRTRKRWNVAVALAIDLDYESGRAATRHTPALESALYRIAQEAVANAARHARASSITVSLTERNNGVRLTIEDDGRGFEQPSLQHPSGFGLLGMQERADLIHGTLTLHTRPGAGTQIRIVAPSQRRAGAGAPAATSAKPAAQEEEETG